MKCANNDIKIVLRFLFFMLSSVCQAHFIVPVLHTKILQIEISSYYYLSDYVFYSLPYKHLLIHYSERI